MVVKRLRAGPFELHKPIGRGGMGEVWGGVHAGLGVPVALKVLKGADAQSDAAKRLFSNEVRAAARLHHPGVVVVLDHGVVDAALSIASLGAFVEGSPYLVMELVSGGALDQVTRPLDWFEIKAVLRALLDALGHAHARGVVHKDIKPANILVNDPGDLRRGIKLTDFGIAHAIVDPTRKGRFEKLQGTAAYMAPEQIQGAWRYYGPWTDLYALGCVAYELIGGQPPFGDGALITLLHKHLNAPLPALTPRTPLPGGVQQWLGGLLQKRPELRFQCAADAAMALEALPDVFPSTKHLDIHLVGIQPQNVDTSAPTVELGELVESALTLQILTRPDTAPYPLPPHAPALIPDTWTSTPEDPEALSGNLQGAGLGLYGLRNIPLVGRHEARERLWGALKAVHASREPQALVIRGAAGIGKSRLSEWLCHKAMETGAGSVLMAEHSPGRGRDEGLGQMVARHLRCLGLDRTEILAHTKGLLTSRGIDDATEWHALTELMSPAPLDQTPEGPWDIRFKSSAERHTLILRLLEWLGHHRPLVVWLDDVQWGHDALDFVRFVLAGTTAHIPALFIMTAREEALVERPTESALLASLTEHPKTDTIDLGPLDSLSTSALVGRLLGLEGDLAAQVESKSAGNPLFAVQLVGGWVQRGILKHTPRGFALANHGEPLTLPDDLHEVWAARLAQILDGHTHRARLSLELAATLGMNVAWDEWRRVCEMMAVDLDEVLIGQLFRARLLDDTGDGFRFVHGMLRESLLRLIREAGRAAELHRACARMLDEAYRARHAGVAGRLGLHLAEAGLFQEALEPLLEGAVQHHITGDDISATTLLARLDALILDTRGSAPPTPAQVKARLLRVSIARRRGQVEDAEAWGDKALEDAQRLGDHEIISKAMREVGTFQLFIKGQTRRGQGLYELALQHARLDGDSKGIAECIAMLARADLLQGHHDASRRRFEESYKLFEALGDERGMNYCLGALGDLYEMTRDLPRARHHYNESVLLARRHGHREALAASLNGLAEIERQLDNLDQAWAQYTEVLALYDSLASSGGACATHLNLTMIELLQARYDEAQARLDKLSRLLKVRGETRWIVSIHLLSLPCAAAARDAEAWDRHIQAVFPEGDHLHESPDPDEARALQMAARLAAEAGWSTKARRAYKLARDIWQVHDQREDVAAIEAAIADLP